MTFIETIKSAVKTIKNNFFLFLAVWGISELIAYAFLKLVTFTLFNLTMKQMGVTSITNQNFMQVLKSPIAIGLFLVTLLSLSILAIIQILALLSLSTNNGSLKNMFAPLKRLRLKDLPALILYTLLIIPFSKLGLTIYFISSLKIPDYVFAGFWDSSFLTVLYYATIFILGHYGLKFIYSFIIFYQEPVTFNHAMKLSFKYTSRRRLWETVGYLSATYLFSLIASMFGLVAFQIIDYLALTFNNYERTIVAIGASLITVSSFIIIVFNSILLIQLLITSYDDRSILIKSNKKMKLVKFLIPAMTIAIAVYGYAIYTPISDVENVKIIAHRGVTYSAVENTVESMEAAKELNANYVELDVQELGDGTIIVLHDGNLKRLTGLNKTVGQLTWPEVEALNLTQSKYSAKIPKFDDYLKIAKNINQPLLVEIKVNSTDSPDFSNKVVELVKNNQMADSVIYHSISRDAMLEVKAIDPDAYVGYILGFTLGKLEDVAVDFYSIDVTSVTKKTVRDANEMNKDVYIWSVDSPTIIEKAFSYNPGAIISDNILEVEHVKANLAQEPLYRMLWQLGI